MTRTLRDWIEQEIATRENWLDEHPNRLEYAGERRAFMDVLEQLDVYPEGHASDLLTACERAYTVIAMLDAGTVRDRAAYITMVLGTAAILRAAIAKATGDE